MQNPENISISHWGIFSYLRPRDKVTLKNRALEQERVFVPMNRDLERYPYLGRFVNEIA